MSKTRWTLVVSLGAASALLVIGWAWIRTDSYRQSRRAAEMLSDLGQLSLDRSTGEDAKNVILLFQGTRTRYPQTLTGLDVVCEEADEIYSTSLKPQLAESVLRRIPQLVYAGIHDWRVDASVQIKEGKLLCASHTITFISDRPTLPSALVFGAMQPRPEWIAPEQADAVFFDNHARGHSLGTVTFPKATQSEIESAFRPSLGCLSSFRGCKYPCELAPTAWQRYETTSDYQHLVLGFGKPPDAEDSRCTGPR